MTLSNTPSWYIVQFKPHSHKVAVRNLQRQGFETFLLMYEVARRAAVKFETVIQPLFAGYMFVACDPEKAPWRQINSTFGVSRMLRFAEGPKSMPEALIARLRARCDSVGKAWCFRKTLRQANPWKCTQDHLQSSSPRWSKW